MMELLISCCLVAEDKTLFAPSQSQTKNSESFGCVGGGGGRSSPVPRLWGWSVCPPPPPSSIPSMLPLQIPCSLIVAQLISNSCAPPSPTRLGEIKRATVSRLLPRWAYVIGLEVNEKVQNTGEHMPSFFS